jgi:hypothetical protein
MEAVRDADGQAMVVALLEDMDRREPNLVLGIKQQQYIARARVQLGLQR